MVRIIDYKERTNSEGETFFALILQGGLELVKSQETGRYYATGKSASITSTFTEEVCQSLIGQEIPGSIKKVECEPYNFTIENPGEVVELSHRWEYFKEGDTMEEVVFEGKPEAVGAL